MKLFYIVLQVVIVKFHFNSMSSLSHPFYKLSYPIIMNEWVKRNSLMTPNVGQGFMLQLDMSTLGGNEVVFTFIFLWQYLPWATEIQNDLRIHFSYPSRTYVYLKTCIKSVYCWTHCWHNKIKILKGWRWRNMHISKRKRWHSPMEWILLKELICFDIKEKN